MLEEVGRPCSEFLFFLKSRLFIDDAYATKPKDWGCFMNEIVHVSRVCELPEIVDIFHDQWFDLDSIYLCKKNLILDIPFQRVNITDKTQQFCSLIKNGTLVDHLWVLRINQVVCFKVKDTEKIGLYDLNEIDYSPVSNLIRVLTGVPLEFAVRVNDFDLSVYTTCE